LPLQSWNGLTVSNKGKGSMTPLRNIETFHFQQRVNERLSGWSAQSAHHLRNTLA